MILYKLLMVKTAIQNCSTENEAVFILVLCGDRGTGAQNMRCQKESQTKENGERRQKDGTIENFQKPSGFRNRTGKDRCWKQGLV